MRSIQKIDLSGSELYPLALTIYRQRADAPPRLPARTTNQRARCALKRPHMIHCPRSPRERHQCCPKPTPPETGPNGKIEAAKALRDKRNSYRPWQRLQQEKSPGTAAWMIYLKDTRVSFSVFKS